jgi:hypothetical protein
VDGDGLAVSITSDSTTVSVPVLIAPNGNSNLATSLSYNQFLQPVSLTGANGATQSQTYDNWNRISTSTSMDRAVTNYTYTLHPSTNTQTATVPVATSALAGQSFTTSTTNLWRHITADGFGRTIKVENGHVRSLLRYGPLRYPNSAHPELIPCGRTSRGAGSARWTGGAGYTYIYYPSANTHTATVAPTTSTTPGQTSTTNLWLRVTTDGFGGTIKVENRHLRVLAAGEGGEGVDAVWAERDGGVDDVHVRRVGAAVDGDGAGRERDGDGVCGQYGEDDRCGGDLENECDGRVRESDGGV